MSEPTKTIVPFGKQGVQLSSLEDAFRFATAVSKSGFAPKGVDTPEAILIAVQFGAELGLTPMSALQSLAIINGRPAIYGDAALALVRASGELEHYTQKTVGEGEAQKAIVTVKRKDQDEITAEFSVADAKKAQLWGKAGPWSAYPTRMLMWRARGFALRDAFGDVLRGLRTAEEVEDMPPIKDVTPAPRAKVPKEQKSLPEMVSETLPPDNAASDGKENPDKVTSAESDKPVTDIAQPPSESPADKLIKLLACTKISFEDIKPHLPRGLAPRDAKSVDDLTEANTIKIIESFDVLMDIVKAEKTP